MGKITGLDGGLGVTKESADADIKGIIEQTEEILQTTLDGFKESYFGTPYGQHHLNDAQFLLWFDEQMRKDGLWPMAWQLVEEGMTDIKRWEKLTNQEVPRVSDMLPALQAAGATIDEQMWPIPLGEGVRAGTNRSPAPSDSAIPR